MFHVKHFLSAEERDEGRGMFHVKHFAPHERRGRAYSVSKSAS